MLTASKTDGSKPSNEETIRRETQLTNLSSSQHFFHPTFSVSTAAGSNNGGGAFLMPHNGLVPDLVPYDGRTQYPYQVRSWYFLVVALEEVESSK